MPPVFRYLHEFLTDGRVIDMPWLSRQLLVRGMIVPKRYKESAANYEEIWTEQGSPLLLYGRKVAARLQEALGEEYAVELAMRVVHARLKQRLSRRLSPRLDYDPGTGRSDLVFVPETLRDVMWLQLADAIARERRYRQCEVCGKWFEIAPDVARTSRMYCATACKLRAYRARQKRARQLRARGTSLREIARELDTSVQTVKGWVADVTPAR